MPCPRLLYHISFPGPQRLIPRKYLTWLTACRTCLKTDLQAWMAWAWEALLSTQDFWVIPVTHHSRLLILADAAILTVRLKIDHMYDLNWLILNHCFDPPAALKLRFTNDCSLTLFLFLSQSLTLLSMRTYPCSLFHVKWLPGHSVVLYGRYCRWLPNSSSFSIYTRFLFYVRSCLPYTYVQKSCWRWRQMAWDANMDDVLVFVHFTFFLLIMIWTIGSEVWRSSFSLDADRLNRR
jgi:hypothetical protein